MGLIKITSQQMARRQSRKWRWLLVSPQRRCNGIVERQVAMDFKELASLYSKTPPSRLEWLKYLVLSGYRPYRCRETGKVVWAITEYHRVPDAFPPTYNNNKPLPTDGLEPDESATKKKIADLLLSCSSATRMEIMQDTPQDYFIVEQDLGSRTLRSFEQPLKTLTI